MNILGILLVLLIGGTVVASAALELFIPSRRTGRRRWLERLATALIVLGGVGFFGSALSAVGGLNWLPDSFEWPVGYATGIISTQSGLYVVPHAPSGRVQVYNRDWNFIRGWHVGASAGTFKLLPSDDDRFDVITARGDWHYVFNTKGELLSRQTYSPATYSSFPDEGTSHFVPTAPWLWVFTSPFIAWAIGAIGIGTLVALEKRRRQSIARHS